MVNKNGFDGYNKRLIKQMNKFNRSANEINQVLSPARTLIENIPAMSNSIINPPPFAEIQRSMDILNSTLPNYLEQYNSILATIPDTSFETMVAEFNRSYSNILDNPLVRTLEEMNSLAQKITQFIPDIENILADTNWEDFELTEEDQEKVKTIINSKDRESAISNELAHDKKTEAIPGNWIKIAFLWAVLPVVLITLGYFAEQSGLKLEEVHSITVSNMKSKELEFKTDAEEKNKPLKHIINDIITKIKKEMPIFSQSFLGIVTKNNLIVREENKVNSKILGKLEAKTIVHIIDQRKNWIYISYFDIEDNIISEGWVFTRYIKKMNSISG